MNRLLVITELSEREAPFFPAGYSCDRRGPIDALDALEEGTWSAIVVLGGGTSPVDEIVQLLSELRGAAAVPLLLATRSRSSETELALERLPFQGFIDLDWPRSLCAAVIRATLRPRQTDAPAASEPEAPQATAPAAANATVPATESNATAAATPEPVAAPTIAATHDPTPVPAAAPTATPIQEPAFVPAPEPSVAASPVPAPTPATAAVHSSPASSVTAAEVAQTAASASGNASPLPGPTSNVALDANLQPPTEKSAAPAQPATANDLHGTQGSEGGPPEPPSPMQEPAPRRSEPPLRMLRQAAAYGASGELVAVDDVAEIHVHLHQGRVAWATSTLAPFAFTRHLVDVCGVDAQAMQHWVAECKRSHLRLGETLIQEGVVTEQQVRSALSAQIANAMATLTAMRCKAVFLPRDSDTPESITFSLASMAPERSSQGAIDQVSGEKAEAVAVVNKLLEISDGLSWASAVANGTIEARFGAPHDPAFKETLLALSTALLSSAGNLVGVRSPYGSVAGVGLREEQGALWCGIGPDASFIDATGQLMNMAGGSASDGAQDQELSPEVELAGEGSLLPTLAPLETAMELVPALVAAMVFSPEDGRFIATKRQGYFLEDVSSRAPELIDLMRSSFSEHLASTATDSNSVHYQALAMQLGFAGYWHFSAQLGNEDEPCLWLVLRDDGLEFGWGLLETLGRQMLEQIKYWG